MPAKWSAATGVHCRQRQRAAPAARSRARARIDAWTLDARGPRWILTHHPECFCLRVLVSGEVAPRRFLPRSTPGVRESSPPVPTGLPLACLPACLVCPSVSPSPSVCVRLSARLSVCLSVSLPCLPFPLSPFGRSPLASGGLGGVMADCWGYTSRVVLRPGVRFQPPPLSPQTTLYDLAAHSRCVVPSFFLPTLSWPWPVGSVLRFMPHHIERATVSGWHLFRGNLSDSRNNTRN